MTAKEFGALCEERTVNPFLVLENDHIVEALKNKDDKLVVEILDTEY